MNVRDATADDLGLILVWGARRHDGSAYRVLPFSEHRCADLLAGLAMNKDGLLLVGEHAGERVGALAAQAMDSRFMEGRVAVLWSLYVEDGRGGAIALPLLRRYIEWAKGRGADLIEANNSASMDDDAFMRIVGRLGFNRSGSHAHLEV